MVALLTIFIPTLIACKPKEDSSIEHKSLYGIAFYQKIANDEMWEICQEKPSKVNSQIKTEENKIVYENIPASLLLIYSQDAITTESKADCFTLNTTCREKQTNGTKFSFEIEKAIECTQMLAYYIFKLDSTYQLSFAKHLTKIDDGSTVSIDFEDEISVNFEVTFRNNLTISEKY